MKRFLMPATALTTLKRVALTLLCCSVLMVFAASAQTIHSIKVDPGKNNPPPSGPILDLGGAYATPPTPAAAIPGNGTEVYLNYTVIFTANAANSTCTDGGCRTVITFAFRDDPAQISFTGASVVDQSAEAGTNLLTNGNFATGDLTGWTYADVYGVTGAGFVGPSNYDNNCPNLNGVASYCWIDGAVQAYDALSQTINTNPGDTYQISFYVAENSGIVAPPGAPGLPAGYAGSACYLALANAAAGGPPSTCYFSDLSTNSDVTDAGGSGINAAVYAQSGLPSANQTLTLTETGLGAGTVQDTLNTSSPPQQSPINCTEAGSGAAQTGTCSESDPIGASVTLTATPNGGSTFGGWGPTPGPCAYAGTTPTCTLTMTSAEIVTASFVAPPLTSQIIPETCSGTNVTGTVNYCPNNPNPISPSNPCTDPNGVQFSISIPVVSQPTEGEACLALNVTATEAKGDGLCSQPALGGESSDFDCRFQNFYNFGTDPTTLSTVTPLCYPYSNGNCTFYTLSLTGGGVPNTELYSGGVFWQIAFNSLFAPPQGSYWFGSTPNLLDDPGEDEISPLPWGTNCSTPMQTDNSVMYPGPYFCQFDNNITTFYTPGGTSFDPVGGKTTQLNDVVVTFLPTTVPTGGSLPTTVAPTAIAINCLGTPPGCTTSGANVTFAEGTGGTAGVTSIGSGSPPTPPYPAPTVTAVTTTMGATASESGNTVMLTTTGSFGSYAVAGNTVMVSNCTPAGYNGTFAIVGGSLTMLSYSDSTSGLGAGTGCQALVLPNGLTFNASTGLLAGTPADGTTGSYPITFTSTNSAGFVTQPSTLTVGPAGTLTITASSSTMTYGGTVPTITPSGSGFVNGDTIHSLTTQPTCSTTATSTSLPGTYPSSCSGAVDANYSTIKYVPGTVTVLGLDISPLTVNFGTLFWGEFGGQFVTLKNNGNAPITITSITLGGGSANGDFGDLTFCPPMIFKLPATLPAGKSCAMGVGILALAQVFNQPSYTYLTVTDTSATQQVLLTAQVIDPLVSLSSTNLSFGSQKTGTSSAAQKVTLTNAGATPLTLTGLKISGNFAFAAGTTCTSSTVLAPGTPCSIYVTFTPTTKGARYSGTVTITDHTLIGTQFISLSGTGN
jgi:hypothetical protein